MSKTSKNDTKLAYWKIKEERCFMSLVLEIVSNISHRLIEKTRWKKGCILQPSIGIMLLLWFCGYSSHTFAQEIIEANLCIEKYEDYLRSLKSISYDFRNVVPSTNYGGTIKYNGAYAYRFVSLENDPNFKYETVCSQEGYMEIGFNKPNEGDMTIFGYLDNAKIENYSIDGFLDVPALCGYASGIYPPLITRYIPELLRDFRPVPSPDRRNGTDLILVSGTKDNISIKAWFDPAQNYPLVSLEINQKEASDGETITMTISFDKFIDVNGVKVPTFYESFHSMVYMKDPSGVYNSKFATEIKNITITENSNPTPFSFQTKIPNGTRAVLFDAQQIEYIWLDGKIVPKTDEAMLAIARGNHKFMPGPDEPRFWLMAIGIILILIGGGKMTYDHFFKNKDDEDMP